MHSNFFSSLNQLEKRLKTEAAEEPPSVPQLQSPLGFTMTESLSNPIYLLSCETKPSSKIGDSELPCEFLSASHKFSTTPDDCNIQPQSPQNQPQMLDEPDESDDIQLLMKLLHLSPMKEKPTKNQDEKHCCDNEFLAKIVGVKGPRCQHEEDRLESWITHLQNDSDGETYGEPFRLTHLLLAKAACLSGDENGHNELEFPSTIQEFLINDPPSKCE